MANLFAVPAPVVGLMGRRQQTGRSILDMINPMQADALDEQMFAAAPNGYVESPQGMYFPAEQAAQAQAMQQMQPGPQAPAQRQRVSALNVLGRAFAPNITGALDTERARLQAEADRPGQLAVSQENERIARALGPQALLALRTSPEKLGESLGYGYRPQVIGQGGIQSVAATGQRVSAPKDFTAGTGVYRSDPLSPGLQQLGEIGPTHAEQNAAERNRIDAIGAGQNTVGRYRIDAEGNPIFEAPQEYTLGNGQTRFENGSAVASVAPTPRAGQNGQAFDATTRGALKSASDAAALARSRAADARRFIELNKNRGTGLGASLLGPAAALDPTYAEMRAISSRLIPQERTPGSGPMSDKDIALYGRSVIDIDKPGPANQAIAGVVMAAAERDSDYASFLDEYATRNGNLAGANEDWQAYVDSNPLFEERGGNTVVRSAIQPWRQFMGWGERQRGGAGRSGGTSGPPRVSTPAEAMALPSGTEFIDPQGVRRIRP